MGGYGSGRPEKPDRKKTTWNARFVDVLDWKRQGLLEPGKRFRWEHTWWVDGKDAFEVSVQSEDDNFEDGELVSWLNVISLWGFDRPRERVILEWTACGYGGTRPWFQCPRCDRRARLLYVDYGLYPISRLACRECMGLAYESQRQDTERRLAERAKRLRRKAGGWLMGDLLRPFPERRKGLHWRTYERLWAEAEEARLVCMALLSASVDRTREHLNCKFPPLR